MSHARMPLLQAFMFCFHGSFLEDNVSLWFRLVGIGWPPSHRTHVGTAPDWLFYDRPDPRLPQISLFRAFRNLQWTQNLGKCNVGISNINLHTLYCLSSLPVKS